MDFAASLAILCFALTACNSTENPVLKDTDPGASPGVLTAYGNYQNVLRLSKHEVIDRQATGRPAISFLIPVGWSVRDSLFWVYQDPNVPVRYAAVCNSRDESMGVDIYADSRAVWSRGMMGTQGEAPPGDIISALKLAVVKIRPGIQVRYTEQKVLPAMALPPSQQGNIRGTSTSDRGYIKFEYEKNGFRKEEIIYGRLTKNMISTSNNGNPDAVAWSLDEVFGCRANKGELAFAQKIALTIRGSARLTLPFYNRLVQVIQLLTNQYYQQIYAAGQISQIISQTNDQILKTISDSYWSLQRSNDRTNQQFSDMIRGVDRYNDGSGLQLQLPSGYSTAWYNKSSNEYMLSDLPGFDPTRVANGDWTALQRQ